MARPPTSSTSNRSVVFAGATFTFPDPVGTVRIRYDNDALEWLEEELDPQLDALNDRIRQGKGPVDPDDGRVTKEQDSVWDALGYLSARRMAKVTRALVTAGIAHQYDGDVTERTAQARADAGTLPPSLWQDADLGAAINRALRTAFGEDVDADPPKAPTAPPPPPDGASASGGTTSSPSGPPPSTSEG